MKIVLTTILVFACTFPVTAQLNVVFYDDFESGDTSGWWAPARVAETGQTTCYDVAGAPIDCAGTGQDGDVKTGVTWPNPRFVDNLDGTVTDMLTGLIWLKDASCADLAGTDEDGRCVWTTALTASAALADGTCGLNDASVAGDWRLPSINELKSLPDREYADPALSDAAGTAQWSEGDLFSGVRFLSSPSLFWTSTSLANHPLNAWSVFLLDGGVAHVPKTTGALVWPVRGGQ